MQVSIYCFCERKLLKIHNGLDKGGEEIRFFLFLKSKRENVWSEQEKLQPSATGLARVLILNDGDFV